MTIDDDLISAVLADHRERRACPEHDRCTVQSVRAGCLCATTVAVIEHLQARSYSSGAAAMRETAADILDCDCDNRAAVLALNSAHGYRRAEKLCVHSSACYALAAAAVRALPLEESQ